RVAALARALPRTGRRVPRAGAARAGAPARDRGVAPPLPVAAGGSAWRGLRHRPVRCVGAAVGDARAVRIHRPRDRRGGAGPSRGIGGDVMSSDAYRPHGTTADETFEVNVDAD